MIYIYIHIHGKDHPTFAYFSRFDESTIPQADLFGAVPSKTRKWVVGSSACINDPCRSLDHHHGCYDTRVGKCMHPIAPYRTAQTWVGLRSHWLHCQSYLSLLGQWKSPSSCWSFSLPHVQSVTQLFSHLHLLLLLRMPVFVSLTSHFSRKKKACLVIELPYLPWLLTNIHKYSHFNPG